MKKKKKNQLKKLKKRIKALEIEVFGEYEVIFEPDERPNLRVVTNDNSDQLAVEGKSIDQLAAEGGDGSDTIPCRHNHTLISGDSIWCYKCENYI